MLQKRLAESQAALEAKVQEAHAAEEVLHQKLWQNKTEMNHFQDKYKKQEESLLNLQSKYDAQLEKCSLLESEIKKMVIS